MEDEIHFLLESRRHESLRVNLLDVASSYIANFHMLSKEEKFCALLSSENSMVTFALAKFSYHAFKHRT